MLITLRLFVHLLFMNHIIYYQTIPSTSLGILIFYQFIIIHHHMYEHIHHK